MNGAGLPGSARSLCVLVKRRKSGRRQLSLALSGGRSSTYLAAASSVHESRAGPPGVLTWLSPVWSGDGMPGPRLPPRLRLHPAGVGACSSRGSPKIELPILHTYPEQTQWLALVAFLGCRRGQRRGIWEHEPPDLTRALRIHSNATVPNSNKETTSPLVH